METTYKCPSCQTEKSVNEYYKRASAKRGHDNICKICRDALCEKKREEGKQLKLSRKSVIPENHRICSKCKIVKSMIIFI